MKKISIIEEIVKQKIVAVIRAENVEIARKIVDACLKGGISIIEIAFTVPFAHELIAGLRKEYPENILILGAGTVLDPETARIAILSGAQYIVTPSLNLETVKLCNRYQIPILPGAMSVKEIIEALEAGADIIKLFPGELFLGPQFIKAVKGPLPYVSLMPTGGVDLENVVEWFRAGAVAVGVGGSLTAGAEDRNYNLITETAKKFTEKINNL